jgi:FLVCR family MFS transporter 7
MIAHEESYKVKPNNLAGIYVVLIAISSVSFILLPVGLELGVEITHNAETSTAILWSGGNTVSVLWVLGEKLLLLLLFSLSVILLGFLTVLSSFPAMNALRDGPNGNPPLNMRRALIFNAAFITGTTLLSIPFTGAQTRRKMDEQKAKDVAAIQMENVQT